MRLMTAVGDAVVVGVDGSSHSDRAVVWAAEQAAVEGRRLVTLSAGRQRGTRLTRSESLTVPEPYVHVGTTNSSHARNAAALAERRRPGLDVDYLVTAADPRQALIDASRGARLIVMGSRGRGIVRSAVLGSVSAAVTRNAECPVVVSRPHRPGAWKSGVLVGSDGTPESRPVIEFAFRMASLRELPLTVIHTYYDPRVPAPLTPQYLDTTTATALEIILARSVAGFTEEYPDVHVTQRVALGITQQQLRQGLHPWSLIVVGRRQRNSWMPGLRGGVATGVLERYRGIVAMVPESNPSQAG